MRRILKKGLCCIGIVAALATTIPAGYGEKAFAAESYKSAIDKAKEEKEALEKLKKETEEKIAALEADKKSTEDYIKKVDEELSAAYLAMEELEEKIAVCEENLRAAGVELDEAKLVNDLKAIPGVEKAVLVSYNGEYME